MDNYREKIDDYFYGSLLESERREVEDWLIENQDNTLIDQQLEAMLEEQVVDVAVDVDRAFERFSKAVHRRTSFGVRYASLIKWSQRVAAVLFLPLLLSVAYQLGVKEDVVWSELYVARGEKQELTLSDGTKLWINSDSRVTYPSVFEGKEREIFIDGEVYADVAKDARHPFIITSGPVKVEVLGTEFNFRSYHQDSKVELALSQGRVLLSVATQQGLQSIYLEPSDLAVYNKLSSELRKRRFNVENYSLTCQNNLYFYNETLADIANQLSRHFDQRIVITDPRLEDMTFYALFTNDESLDEILDTFNADKQLRIEKHNDDIYISKK
ncbi:MAG: FecR domain-containing protein [Rikenellaceae bacterium]